VWLEQVDDAVRTALSPAAVATAPSAAAA